jgi:hypothetical protein
VLVGHGGGLGTARVEQDHAAAARLNRFHARAHPRRRHDAAVGSERVRAHHEKIAGTVDVRNREQQRVAEHLGRRAVVRELVDARRAEAVARAECAQEAARGQERAAVVDVRVAEIDRDGVVAVLRDDRFQTFGDQVERGVPRDGLPAVGGAADWRLEAVRVGVQVDQRVALGADVAVG